MLSIIIKDTSFLMWITIWELTYECNQINIYTYNPTTAYLVGAVIYFAMFLLVQGMRKLVMRGNKSKGVRAV